MARAVRLLPMGDAALLVEVEDVPAVLAVAAALRGRWQRGGGVWATVEDVVPAARTVLVRVRDGTDLDPLRAAVVATARDAPPPEPTHEAAGPVRVPVVYAGPDLAEVARFTGLTERQVVAAHTGTPWTAAFAGFAPGFAYLVGGDPRLRVPRRAEPRTDVPAGAVGLAGEFSGVYPRRSPGGWQLLGTTDAVLWDLHRDPPALLAPGAVVRFEDAG